MSLSGNYVIVDLYGLCPYLGMILGKLFFMVDISEETIWLVVGIFFYSSLKH